MLQGGTASLYVSIKYRGDMVTRVGEATRSRVLDILELIEDFGRVTARLYCDCSSRVLMEKRHR